MIKLTISNNCKFWVIQGNSDTSTHCKNMLTLLYNGMPHNRYKPAITYNNSSIRWCINGLKHRLDGPAVERVNGEDEYWINHIRYNTYLEYLVVVEQYKKSL